MIRPEVSDWIERRADRKSATYRYGYLLTAINLALRDFDGGRHDWAKKTLEHALAEMIKISREG
ncbi:MAG TPA: hypothetical protein VKC66_18400 [Xanthobacteraceae bacterium]|nr:hypothetical protein [Xanthobacteraceae bacterium]